MPVHGAAEYTGSGGTFGKRNIQLQRDGLSGKAVWHTEKEEKVALFALIDNEDGSNQ